MVRERKKESEKEALEILIYIFCEGKNDEQYLTKIKDFIIAKAKFRSNKIDYEIKINKRIKDLPTFNLKCKELFNDIKVSKVYWFFDVDFKEDRHKWINKQDDNVNYCRVNPCLEFLLLLHKYNNKSEIDKELKNLIKNRDNYNKYLKNNNPHNDCISLKDELKKNCDSDYIKGLDLSQREIEKVITIEKDYKSSYKNNEPSHKDFYSEYNIFFENEFIKKLYKTTLY
jgi:hypothetical protein